MAIQYGILALSWIGEWSNESGLLAIQRASRAGYDLLEVSLVKPDTFDANFARKKLIEYGMKGRYTLVLPPEAHMPAYPKEALTFLKKALTKVEEAEETYLGGVLYGNPGMLTRKPPDAKEREICINILGEVAIEASKRGITLGIEPVNRFETYLYNCTEDTLELIRTLGAGNVTLHLDTFHMNIEEHGFATSFKKAGKILSYMHISESDRGKLGDGNVDRDDVFRGLADIGYNGPLVIESFAELVPELAGAICLWRPSKYSSDELACSGLSFIKEKAKQYGLE